jgi:hypothetical protein
MDDLIAFLRARLAEDAAAAKAAAWDEDMSARWTAASTPYGGDQGHPRWYVNDAYDDGVIGKVDPQGNDDEGVARHIARHDPARVLAEVDAKRRRLELLADAIRRGHDDSDIATELLPLEALPYADHPDYKDTWRP